MSDNYDTSPLPPGWDRKYDHRTGRHYFINYFNKTTTWEDPRQRYRQLNQVTPQHVPAPTVMENIPLQSHGPLESRGYHVYPSDTYYFSPQHAFQSPSIRGQSAVRFQDLGSSRPSPIQSQSHAAPNITPFSSPARTAETNLQTDTDASVAKISAMFPTVSDTHIKTLLMKYHNREALVMSALQVEKYPISTPGPYATPPLQGRHFTGIATGVYCGLQMTPPLGLRDGSRTGSPIQRPGSAGSGSIIAATRPHSSPKMKLRYLKSVFPKVDETLLLDILSNSDNNVQKATEKLLTMGFEKRDTPPPRLTLRRKEEEQKAHEQSLATPAPPPRMKSLEEKQKMKARLQELHQDVPDRVVTMALESVDFDEERAAQILQFMVQEEKRSMGKEVKPIISESKSKEVKPTAESEPSTSEQTSVIESELVALSTPVRKICTSEKPEKGLSKRSKGKKDVSRVSRGTSTTEDKEYKSPYVIKTGGPDPSLHKGPNDELLLADYVTWNGPNPDLLHSGGRVSLAKGPNKSLLGERKYHAKGPNSELRKGPLIGLAKGSIYSRLNGNGQEESRGK
ncbi:uncharacterized protein [Anabrus simplex]|uniref:uncharacterized protein isoform X1 n=1 Tax=Anabrus simplex TaxID=316456 RepID=UPI0035A2FB0E